MTLFFRRKPILQETSTNLNMETLQPFLERLALLIPSGFGQAEIDRIVALAKSTKADDEQELEFPIQFDGQRSVLKVGIFMDDIDSPDIYLHSPPKLAEQIDGLIGQFIEEQEASL